jgi:hypothetical protein
MLNKTVIISMCSFLLVAFVSTAQQTQSLQQTQLSIKQADESATAYIFELRTVADQTVNQVKLYIQQTHPYLQQSETEMRIINEKKSQLGTHYYFAQYYKGVPIYKGYYNVHIDKNGTIFLATDQLADTRKWDINHPLANDSTALWMPIEGKAIAAQKIVNETSIVFRSLQGEVLLEKDNRFNFFKEDTMISAKVFLPDPLTSKGVIYGQDGLYLHYNDSDYALINDERKPVQFPATFENDSFRLRNRYAQILNLQVPDSIPVVSHLPVFDFTRRQSGFKETMAMYHIYSTQQYFQSLGINELNNYSIKVDPLAGTADNSSFNFSTDTSLYFGIGGVPDAEDADVITHEYTHALSWFMNASPNMSTERRSIEEAICDIIAAVYSKKYSDFNWQLVYNFDGPNPVAQGAKGFWGGRTTLSPRNYSSLSGSLYADALIWSGTMMDIIEQIGTDTAVKMMLNSIYLMTENTTMPQAARLMMMVDSMMFNKAYGWKIGPVLFNRGMGDFPLNMPNTANHNADLWKVYNSYGFAQGESDLLIHLKQAATLSIIDITGREVAKYLLNEGNNYVSPSALTNGYYTFSIQFNNSLSIQTPVTKFK